MSFFDFTDPNSNGQLLGLLSGLGQAAMPSRLPVPFGAVLGMGASGMMKGQQQQLANQKAGLELKTGNLGYAQLLNQLDAQMKLAGHPEGVGFLGNLGGTSLPSPGPSQPPPGAPPMGTRMDVLNAAGGGDIAAGAANLGTQPAANNPALQSLAPPSLVAGGKGRVAGGLPPGITPEIWNAMDAASRSKVLEQWTQPADLRENQARYAYGQAEPLLKNTNASREINDADRAKLGLKPGDKGTIDSLGKVTLLERDPSWKAAEEGAVANAKLPSEIQLRNIPQAPLSPERFSQEKDLAKYNQSLRTGADISPDDPNVANFGKQILGGNFTAQQVPAQYRTAVAAWLNNQPTQAYSPIAANRFARAAEAVRTQYLKQPGYELAANGLPYVLRIEAAMQKPGSVSDQDLLDSFTKLNTAGNAITDAQVKVITDGKSLADWAGTIANKFRNGGILSTNQRQQIYDLSHAVYSKYLSQYAPVMEQATAALQGTGIPKAFWGIPDVKAIADRALAPDTGGQQGANNPPPKTYPTPPPAAVQHLKLLGPSGAKDFDEIFGPGAAAKALGAK